MDNPEKAWQELNEQRRREYNHPEGSACPVCNGSGHVMKIWSDSEYYHGLLTICPECGTVRLKEDDLRKPEPRQISAHRHTLRPYSRQRAAYHRAGKETAGRTAARAEHRHRDHQRSVRPTAVDPESDSGAVLSVYRRPELCTDCRQSGVKSNIYFGL